MSYGSNHPRRYERPHWRRKADRHFLVHDVGCVECNHIAGIAEDDPDYLLGFIEQHVRIPRSLRPKCEALDAMNRKTICIHGQDPEQWATR